MNKRIIPGLGVKDDSGAYVKVDSSPPEDAPKALDPEVSLESIHNQLMLILTRETHRLTKQSASDLLSKDQGIAFERCVKVLREFKKEEREYLAALKTAEDKGEDHE